MGSGNSNDEVYVENDVLVQGIGSPIQMNQGRSSNPCRHDFRAVLSECVDDSLTALYAGFAGITRKHR